MQVIGRAADASVSHNRGSRAGLPGRTGVAVAARAASRIAIEGVVAGKLVAHLVRYIVDIESVALRAGRTCDSAGFAGRVAHHAEVGDAAAARAHDVADIVVGRADDAVHVGLVLGQHKAAIGIGVSRRRLSAGATEKNQLVVVGYQHHAHGQFFLVHAHYTVHGGYLTGHYASHGVAFG